MTLYLCHLLQFLILYPAAILCFLPMKNQLAQNKMKVLILTFCVLTIYIPIGAWLVNYTSISSNLVLFPSLILFFATYCKMVKSNFGECLAPSASDNAENEETKTEEAKADETTQQDLPFQCFHKAFKLLLLRKFDRLQKIAPSQ